MEVGWASGERPLVSLGLATFGSVTATVEVIVWIFAAMETVSYSSCCSFFFFKLLMHLLYG